MKDELKKIEGRIGEIERAIIAFLYPRRKAMIEEIKKKVSSKGEEIEIEGAVTNLCNSRIVRKDGYYLSEYYRLTRTGRRLARKIINPA